VIERLLRDDRRLSEDCMVARIAKTAACAAVLMMSCGAYAQDVPGIEICTVEKTMERRTSCLQSNVDFLQKTINKLTQDHQQKIDAANRQIEALKSAMASTQKMVVDLQKAVEDAKKAAAPPAKDAAPATKEGAK
jgi:prefoldin subunit 5